MATVDQVLRKLSKVTKKVTLVFEDNKQFEDEAVIEPEYEKEVDERCKRINELLLKHTLEYSELQSSDSDSDDYDSDLEKSLDLRVKSKEEFHKDSCKDIYLQHCRDLKVIPASLFARNCNTSSINLKHYGLGTKGACAVAKAMRYNQTVRELNLHDNSIGEEGLKEVCGMMAVNLWITKLDLSANRFSKPGYEELANMVKNSVMLKNLNLSRCKIRGGCAKGLISAFSDNRILELLDLSDNDIGDEGAVCFGEVFHKNNSLKSLDLGSNSISFLSAEVLCNGLSNNTSLTELSLGWNGMGDIGASFICTVLERNTTLKVLNLVHNHISATGIEYIAGSLHYNTTLEVLKIGKNPFLANGARLILQSLEENPDTSLRELSLEAIAFDKNCEDLLSALMAMLPRFTCNWNGSFRGGAVIGGEQALPRELYLNAIYAQGFRLLDFFRYLTKDGTLLTKEDFINGSKKRNFPFGGRELAGVFDYLDPKRGGCISFEEFLFVKNDQRQAKMKKKRKSMSVYPESPIPQFQRLIRS